MSLDSVALALKFSNEKPKERRLTSRRRLRVTVLEDEYKDVRLSFLRRYNKSSAN